MALLASAYPWAIMESISAVVKTKGSGLVGNYLLGIIGVKNFTLGK